MIKKYKFHIIVATVLILFVVMTRGGKEPNSELVGEGNDNTAPKVLMGDTLVGVLEVSDNLELGNYKLITETGEIYIRTRRDFSALAGSEVKVAIDGTPESFILSDIYVSSQ